MATPGEQFHPAASSDLGSHETMDLPEALKEWQTRQIALTSTYDVDELTRTRIYLQRRVTNWVLPCYVFTVLATFVLIFLHGASIIAVPQEVLVWIGPAVIGEFVSSVGLIFVYLFKASGHT